MMTWENLLTKKHGVSSMSLSNAQRDGFDQRLNRIKKGGANTMGEVQIGPRDESERKGSKHANTVRLKKKKNKKVKDLDRGSSLGLLPLAGFFGGLSMFVGQAMDYQLFNAGGLFAMSTPHPALEPYMQYAPFFLGGVLAMLFAFTFRFSGGLRAVALAAGFWAVFQYQTTLVTIFPGMYAGFFSKEFVEGVFASL
jgi:hypothetical protein